MKHRKLENGYVVRLEKDELLVASLTEFCAHNGITAGWISGLGGAQWAKLGFYNLAEKEYSFKKLETDLEITNIEGNVAQVDGAVGLHLHGTFSDKDFHAYGGHVKEVMIAGTGEFFVRVFDEPLKRRQSDEIGLKLLDL